MNRTAPATLITGPEGSGAPEGGGTEEVARRLAAQLLCQQGTACGLCASCQKFQKGTHPDFLFIEPEKDSIKIEAIREVGRRLSVQPLEAERVVVSIRRAESMTDAAANALLKTLEEPPPFAFFILVTAVPEKLPPTIRSRCRRISVASPPLATLQEQIAPLLAQYESSLIARLHEGSSFSAASSLAEELVGEPEKITDLLSFLKAWWHDLAVFEQTGDEKFLLFPQAAATLASWVKRRPGGRIFEDLDRIHESERDLEGNVNKTLLLERLFFKLMS